MLKNWKGAGKEEENRLFSREEATPPPSHVVAGFVYNYLTGFWPALVCVADATGRPE